MTLTEEQREKAREYRRRYKEKHPEKVKEYSRKQHAKWRKNNLEKKRKYNREYMKRLRMKCVECGEQTYKIVGNKTYCEKHYYGLLKIKDRLASGITERKKDRENEEGWIDKIKINLGYEISDPHLYRKAYIEIEQVEDMFDKGIIDEEEKVEWFNKLKVKFKQ